MDFIIASYFSEKLDKLLEFKDLILSRNQLTLFLKMKILTELMTKYDYFKDADKSNKLKQDLHDIINIRDDFAHGEIRFDINNMEPFLKYYRDGIKKRKITQEHLDEIHLKIQQVNDQLTQIYHQIIIDKYETKET